jgi:putative redox protein
MNAKVVWSDGLTFTGTADTGFAVPLGADPEVGGANDGFRPMELMALSLAGCTAMDVISILRKKRQEVTAFEVKVQARRAEEHPKVFTTAVIEYELTGLGIEE